MYLERSTDSSSFALSRFFSCGRISSHRSPIILRSDRSVDTRASRGHFKHVSWPGNYPQLSGGNYVKKEPMNTGC